MQQLFAHAQAAHRQRPREEEIDGAKHGWAVVLIRAGWYAWTKGLFDEAEQLCSSSVQMFESLSEVDEAELAYGRGMHATVYQSQGRTAEAETMKAQVMGVMVRVPGDSTRARNPPGCRGTAFRQGAWL